MMRIGTLILILILISIWAGTSVAQIVNWQTGEVIAGTQAIALQEGVRLDGLRLPFADFSVSQVLTNSLAGASFRDGELSNAKFDETNLVAGDFSNANLTDASMRSTDLRAALLHDARLVGADLSDSTLIGIRASNASFTHAILANADLTAGYFADATFQFADLTGATLLGADFRGANLSNTEFSTSLANAIFSNAIIDGTVFHQTNLSPAQLAETGSYKSSQLHGVVWRSAFFSGHDFGGLKMNDVAIDDSTMHDVSFRDADVMGCSFRHTQFGKSDLTNADFSFANLSGADLSRVQSDGTTFKDAEIRGASVQALNSQQFYSTADYRRRELVDVRFDDADLSGWDFTNQVLRAPFVDRTDFSHASFSGALLTDVDFSSATLHRANFHATTLENVRIGAMSFEQFSQTQNFAERSLSDVAANGESFDGWDLSGFDFTATDVTGANFRRTNLQRADFSGVDFEDVDITRARIQAGNFADSNLQTNQVESTESYAQRDLRLANFDRLDFVGIDLAACMLEGASFQGTRLENANFKNSNLTEAKLGQAVLTDADLTDAIIQGAKFNASVPSLVTQAQIYSTASYKERTMGAVDFSEGRLHRWNFASQDLVGSNFSNSQIVNSDLTDADLEGARFRDADLLFSDLRSANLTNTDLVARMVEVDLSGANLSGATVLVDQPIGVKFSEQTIFNQWTTFHGDFDPVGAGLRFVEAGPGDLNADGQLNIEDVVYLEAKLFHPESVSHLNESMFDINADEIVSREDLTYWITRVRKTWIGDSNLDGEFNSTDFVLVLSAGEYNDSVAGNSSWSTGDWNGDGEFDSGDFVAAFRDGGYEIGVRRDSIAIPEPADIGITFAVIVYCVGTEWIARRRRHSRDCT